jgi:hypothetical protein
MVDSPAEDGVLAGGSGSNDGEVDREVDPASGWPLWSWNGKPDGKVGGGGGFGCDLAGCATLTATVTGGAEAARVEATPCAEATPAVPITVATTVPMTGPTTRHGRGTGFRRCSVMA